MGFCGFELSAWKSIELGGTAGGVVLLSTRRTTLSLPDPLLRQAERLTNERRQTLSAAVAGLLEQALKERSRDVDRPSQVLEMWMKAFRPLTEDEMLLVDGIVVEEPHNSSR